MLVRAWRMRALLTQEQLAERAGLSIRSIRRLESGALSRPRSTSIRLVAEGLGLDAEEQAVLVAAARNRSESRENSGSASTKVTVPLEGDSAALSKAVPRQLPPNAVHFIGRRDELAALNDLLGKGGPGDAPDPKVIALVGSAGIGKTALAVRWASMAADAFPDGSLYLNLRGFGTLPPVAPVSGLTMLLRGLDVPVEEIPQDLGAASALLRTRTAGRRLLVLLDNALNADQVRPLLPGRGSVVLVTSRDQMRGLMVRDATARIGLPPLAPGDSVALLRRIAGADAVAADDCGVLRLIELCDHSPLAIRIIGERIARQPNVPLPDMVEEILGSHNRLEAFTSGDDVYSDLRTVLSWSYAKLDAATARVLRLVCGLYPGTDFSTEAACAVAGTSMEQTRGHLDRLVATHLVEPRGRGRYSCHDLIRRYARQESHGHDSPAERAAAVERLLAWFLHCLHAADRAFAPDRVRSPMADSAQWEVTAR